VAIKILIVEDDIDVSRTLVEFLIKTGFKAKSGVNPSDCTKSS